MNEALEHYLVKREIIDLLHARARGADRYDSVLMKGCHPEDGTDNHGTYQGPMHGFIDGLEVARLKGPECFGKLHIIGNALFEFLDNGDVFVESYHVAHETYAEGDGRVFFHIGGRYLDTFRCCDGRWLIQHRDIVYDWSRVMPATQPFGDSQTQPVALMGNRTPGDPLYVLGGAVRGRLPSVAGVPDPSDRSSTEAVQQLLDKQEIAEVLYRRARAGDRADAELAHGCYHPGATERHGMFDGLATEFIDVVSFTRPKPGSPIKGMMHFISNILCEFGDAEHAFVETYHIAWCQMTDGMDATIVGRYLDKFEKREGRWAIVHRDVIFDASRMDPETFKYWEKYPAAKFLRGQRGANDPLYGYIGRGG
ncbi:nuclear transport factor 2 family protein [Caballeronia sordidicola]|uniref:nuclear transport factor 2 family protein n=1 Tax=Caballeronia sordidicola TaxID=196367 RepID=UPI00068DD10C|nr:nuclear transport factor 2 family protein [Caballeronia sordidicola]